MDDPATAHDLNVLIVAAAEGYKEFVAGLQKEIAEAISARSRRADVEYFTGKVLQTEADDVQVYSGSGRAPGRKAIAALAYRGIGRLQTTPNRLARIPAQRPALFRHS